MHKIRKKQHSFNVALKRARVSGSSCVWLSECCSMAHRLGAVFSFAHRGGPAVAQCVSVVGDWRGDALAAAAAALGPAGKEAAGRGARFLSAGTELVSRARIQLFGPLPARWRVVATLSPRASLAALLCRPMGN